MTDPETTSGEDLADLRGRIAWALTRWAIQAAGAHDIEALPRTQQNAIRDNSLARANAVLAEVKTDLDAKDADRAQLLSWIQSLTERIGELQSERDRLREALQRVQKYADEIETWGYLDGIQGSSVAADIEAALDQAPAEEANDEEG